MSRVFCHYLNTWHMNNPLIVKVGDVIVEKEQKIVTLEENELSLVAVSDYCPDDSNSPPLSLHDLQASVASAETSLSAISLTNPIFKFQSIEELSRFSFLKPLRCHLKPVCKSKKLENDEDDNNYDCRNLVVSSVFGWYDPVTQENRLPLVAVKPLTDEFKEEVGR